MKIQIRVRNILDDCDDGSNSKKFEFKPRLIIFFFLNWRKRKKIYNLKLLESAAVNGEN